MPERDHGFLAPSDPASSGGGLVEPPSQRMTNEDFRKLMMTPRAGSSSSSSATPVGVLGAAAMTPRAGDDHDEAAGAGAKASGGGGGSSEKAEKRRKKKSYYAKLKRQEDDKMAELAAKYRDRAKERRDGVEGGGVAQEGDGGDGDEAAAAGSSAATSGYRAVAPDVRSSHDAAERRRQMIQESKFLGGDMEHTHLVKGLDFALLQKVRSEIAHREAAGQDEEDDEDDEDVQDEEAAGKPKNRAARRAEAAASKKEGGRETSSNLDPVAEVQKECRTNMAKNVVRTVFKSDLPRTNELFLPGRMAYVIDLEEGEFADGGTDIPTTTIRSKADVEAMMGGAASLQQHTTLSTNDIVINKLTQILSYLRAGSRNKKKKKHLLSAIRGKDEMVQQELINLRDSKQIKAAKALPIYDDMPEIKSSRDRDRDRRDNRHRDRERDRRDHRDHHRDDRDRRRREERGDRRERKPYFDVKEEEDDGVAEPAGGLREEDREYIKKLSEREKEKSKREKEASKGGIGLSSAADDSYGYAECYPGMVEMNDAIGDSDDEADFTKMDLGSKKGPVGRWDFDTAEEYADYMSRKEALPKAAFQYGVKMTEGRKTRGKVGSKNEKAKLNQEWSKISAIIDKRKGGGGGGGGDAKKARVE